ncbi:glycosyltransferase, partial [candidate division KSB1 bacterium]|nr:glycosyltransferase [candidate division KSB1 bacterium]
MSIIVIDGRHYWQIQQAICHKKNQKMVSENKPVAHLVGTYLNRTQNWIYNQIRFQTGYPAVVLGLRTENRNEFPCDNVYSLQPDLSTWRFFLERCACNLQTGYYPYHYQIANKQEIRLLHAHFGRRGLRSLPLAKALGVPIVTSFYGADMSVQRNGLENLKKEYAPLFKTGKIFLVEGPAAKKQLESIGCSPEKIRIQRLGVNLEKITFKSRPVTKKGPIRVLMAATFTEKKGLPYGMEAFCQAARENPRLQLTVVGDARPTKPEEALIKKHLQNIVSQYDMNDRVDFLGYIANEELKQVAFESHIFMQPSVIASTGDTEGGSPVAITQMAASGLPIISTYHCDIPEAVLDGTSGLLVDERNVEQLRLAILKLANDANLRLKMGKQGRKHISQHFCARKQGEKLSEIYREALGESKLEPKRKSGSEAVQSLFNGRPSKRPSVSVMMTVYNAEKYVAEAIESIQNQTLQNFEFVIVDDGSDDSTPEILRQAEADARIKVITKPRMGRAHALNVAWKNTKSDYIANIDADDLAEPFRLAKQVAFLKEHPEVGLLGTASKILTIPSGNERVLHHPLSNRELRSALVRTCPFVHSSVMMPRHALEKVGGYNEHFTVALDYELWIRIADYYEVANLEDVLIVKRVTQQNFFRTKVPNWQRCQAKMVTRWSAWSKFSRKVPDLRFVFDPLRKWLRHAWGRDMLGSKSIKSAR